MHLTTLCVSRDNVSLITATNLDLAPGSIHVIQGPNGTGKSTLAYAIMGHPLYTITGGTITLDGQDLTYAAPEYRARAGVFLAVQQPMPLPGISWYALLKESYQAIRGSYCSSEQFQKLLFPAMDALELDHAWIYRIVHEGFSGGERKRFEVLQVLLLKPRVVLLDEVDSGLDPHACCLVGKALAAVRGENPSMRIVIITHTQALLEYLKPTHWHFMQAGMLMLNSRGGMHEKS